MAVTASTKRARHCTYSPTPPERVLSNYGSVFSKKINSYVRIFVNMADFYVAAKIRKFVFSKALRIFAATNFVSFVRKSREGLFALQRAQSQISWMFYRFSSAHMFWQ